jgi:hypothetical protein
VLAADTPIAGTPSARFRWALFDTLAFLRVARLIVSHSLAPQRGYALAVQSPCQTGGISGRNGAAQRAAALDDDDSRLTRPR